VTVRVAVGGRGVLDGVPVEVGGTGVSVAVGDTVSVGVNVKVGGTGVLVEVSVEVGVSVGTSV
jgi:hypothetical protein